MHLQVSIVFRISSISIIYTHFMHLQVSIVFRISSISIIYTHFMHLQSTQPSLV
jgi:hypothetical protein